jgi:hypothetical protein
MLFLRTAILVGALGLVIRLVDLLPLVSSGFFETLNCGGINALIALKEMRCRFVYLPGVRPAAGSAMILK